MKNYKKFLELKNKVKKMAGGGEVDNQQSPFEAGEEATARKSAVLKNAGISSQQTNDEIQEEASEKKRRELENFKKYAQGGQVQQSQQKQYQAKDYFGKGSNGGGEGVANSMGIMMNQGGKVNPIDQEISDNQKMIQTLSDLPATSDADHEQKRKDLIDSYQSALKDAYDRKANSHSDGGDVLEAGAIDRPPKVLPTPAPTPSDPEKDATKKKYADGGMVATTAPSNASANTASSLSPLLKESYAGPGKKKKPIAKMATGGWTPEQLPKAVHPLGQPNIHAPAEKKYPINIPRAPRLGIPKRLRPVGDIRGYDDGGDVQQDEQANPSDPMSGNVSPEQYQANLEALKTKYKLGQPVQGDEQDITANQGPYPGEEEEADKAGDMSTDKQVSDEIAELADKEKPSEDEDKETAEAPEEASKDESEDKESDDKADEEETADKDKTEDREPAEESPKEEISPEDEAKLLQDKPEVAQAQQKTELQKAQEYRDKAQMWNQLGAIAERGAAAYAGIKPTQQETYKENMQIAQQAVDDVQNRMKYQGYDPNSNLSKTYRQYLEKFSGQPVSPQTSAADIQGVMPLVFKDFEAKEAQKTRAAIANEKTEERLQQTKLIVEQKREAAQQHNELMKALGESKATAAAGAKADKQEKGDLDRVDKMNKMITEDIATSRSAFGVAARNKQSVDNIKALLSGTKDFNDLDNRQVVEVARVLDRVLSGGQSTISGSEHLTPESARQWIAKKMEFITSRRQGAGAGSFVKTMSDTLDREGNQADKQIKATQSKMMGPYQSLAKNDPDSRSYQNYVATLKAHGLDTLLPDSEKEQAPEQTAPGKTVVRKGYNAKTNQTQLIYNDGTSEIKDGKI